MFNDVIVVNIREYLAGEADKEIGEEELQEILSEFLCDKNPDVEQKNYWKTVTANSNRYDKRIAVHGGWNGSFSRGRK